MCVYVCVCAYAHMCVYYVYVCVCVQELDKYCKQLMDMGVAGADARCGELVEATVLEMRAVDEYTVQLSMMLEMEEGNTASGGGGGENHGGDSRGGAGFPKQLAEGPIDLEKGLRLCHGNSMFLLELVQADLMMVAGLL